MTRKALLSIGAGRLQLATLRWARQSGLFVVASDRDPDAPGRKLVDRLEVLSGDDVEGLTALGVELARERGLAGVWASNDFGLRAAAAIGAATGAPTNPADAVELALDKHRACERWRAVGLETTHGRLVHAEGELERALAELGSEVVIKPLGASGSRGVRAVSGIAQARTAFEEACGHGSAVVVEARVDGLHVDVNGFFREGSFRPAGILDRHFSEPPYCVPLWGSQPSSLAAEAEHETYALVERAARALGIHVGPVKADVIWSGGQPVILELAPRFHGDVSTAHVTPLCLGKSPIQAWFASLANAGGPFDEMPLAARRHAGWMAILPDEAGALRTVHGVERARAMAGIEEVALLRREGYEIGTLGDNRAVCGFLWASGTSKEQVHERLRRARACIAVEMEATCQTVA